jgi:hypothetical protein
MDRLVIEPGADAEPGVAVVEKQVRLTAEVAFPSQAFAEASPERRTIIECPLDEPTDESDG